MKDFGRWLLRVVPVVLVFGSGMFCLWLGGERLFEGVGVLIVGSILVASAWLYTPTPRNG